MNKQKVLIAESGSGYGGTAKYLAGLLSQLDRRQFAVEVAACGDGPFVRQIIQRGETVWLKKSWRFPWGDKKNAPAWRYLSAGAVQLAALVPFITAWLIRRRVRLVHLNNEILSHLPLLIASKLAGARVLCHLHGWRELTKTEKRFVKWVDEFVAISEAGAGYFGRQMTGRKVTAVPNGISVNGELDDLQEKRTRQRKLLNIDPETKVGTILGRLVAWKGQRIFLEALAKVIQTNKNTVGIILGHDETPEKAELRKLKEKAKELGIESQVRFLPWQEDVWSVYAASDVIVHASTEPEPFGLVILEAMLAGRSVIATRGGGVTDLVIHGQTGELVKPGDIAQLAEAIRKHVTDPAYTERLIENARIRAFSEFTMERNAEKMAKIYETLLTNN